MAAVGDRMVVGTADGQVVEFHLAGGDAAGETWTSSRCLEVCPVLSISLPMSCLVPYLTFFLFPPLLPCHMLDPEIRKCR